MNRVKTLLVSGLFVSGLMAAPAHADQVPVGGAYDSRMRYVAYNPGQVVHLSTIVGATMVVSFAPSETVTSVAENGFFCIWRPCRRAITCS